MIFSSFIEKFTWENDFRKLNFSSMKEDTFFLYSSVSYISDTWPTYLECNLFITSLAPSLFPPYRYCDISTKAFVVPDMAERTTIFCCPSSVISLHTSFIRCGLPTEVPPNFNTFIFVVFICYSIVFISLDSEPAAVSGLTSVSVSSEFDISLRFSHLKMRPEYSVGHSRLWVIISIVVPDSQTFFNISIICRPVSGSRFLLG